MGLQGISRTGIFGGFVAILQYLAKDSIVDIELIEDSVINGVLLLVDNIVCFHC